MCDGKGNNLSRNNDIGVMAMIMISNGNK